MTTPAIHTPVYVPGQVLTIADTNSWLTWQAAFKTAATSRASTTTVTADPDLQLTVLANAFYQMLCVIRYNGSSGNNNLTWAFGVPSGASMTYSHWNYFGGTLRPSTAPAAVTQGGNTDGTSTRFIVICRGLLMTATAGGTLSFNWAQSVSSATATVVDQYSHLRVRRVG